ncbi:MAG: ribosome biogenesis GTP-binding protein YihA/YsxC [Proteobacteria bacterium]|nr:ribosome biogenesis GTP-binding protein YihA/YsxC [Pseudomonadota bacterium]MDA1323617.1 ribosome biogenesis GTP-binding protein YihA/YsxC [Pseudomonadota bacterium]
MQDADSLIDAEALEYGRKLFERECRFVAGANSLEMLPDPTLTEIAFAGRSNVGKSSLINTLTRHNALARTSRTPGRTQQINFFQLGSELMLVDLPGYGFARASKEKIGNWTALIHAYLLGRPNLRRLCLLIDARHGLKKTDEAIMDELDKAAVVYQIVLTKADKMSRTAIEGLVKKIVAMFPKHPAAYPTIIVTSSRDGAGIEALRASLATLAAPDQFG